MPPSSFPASRRTATHVRSVWSWGDMRALVRLWLRRWRHRRALAELHPEQMQEAGLNSETVRREACRPFWQA